MVNDCRGAGGEAGATMAGLRRLYEIGAVVPLPFLTSSQLPPAALLADAREGWYLPSLESLHLVRLLPSGYKIRVGGLRKSIACRQAFTAERFCLGRKSRVSL